MGSGRIYKDLGGRIRGLRKAFGLTQDQLAKEVGISRASLANIEAGRQQVLVHHLFALATALDLESPAALLPPKRTRAQPSHDTSTLPLSDEGLTEKQRHEVLRLMGDSLNSNRESEESGDE